MSTITSQFPTVNQLGPHAGNSIARQFETVCRAMLHGPDVVATREFLRFITNEPHPFGNFAIVSNPSNRDHTKTAIQPLLSLEAPTAIVFPGDVSEDVETFARQSGFVPAEMMPAMAVHIDFMPRTSLPSGYALRRFTSIDDDPAWCEAFAPGFGIPRRVADAFGPRAAQDLLESGTIQYFGIMNDDTMVATSLVFLEGGVAGVYCVSTLPEHRGKGLAAFATAEPLRQARSLGYQTGILQSTAMGESVYRRLGFQQFGVMPLYVRMPVGMSAAH